MSIFHTLTLVNNYYMKSEANDKINTRHSLKQQCITLTATPWLQKTKLHNACYYIAQNSNFSKTESFFKEKMSSGFPSDVLQLLCLSAAFYLVSCPQQRLAAAAAAAYMLLSGTSVNHRVEAEQLWNIRGKSRENQFH